jgi:transposase
MEEKVRCNNRIQAFLDRNGIVMPACKAFSMRWKQALMQYMGSGHASLELRYAYDHYVYLERKNEQVDQEMIGYAQTHWKKEYQLIRSVTGFGIVLSCYIIAFVHPVERFLSNKKLRRYAGVIPVSKESGDYRSMGHIPKSSSKALLRWALVQAANTIGKTDTRLGKYYRMKKKQKKNTGIAKIAVASTLVDILYKILTTKKPYISATDLLTN